MPFNKAEIFALPAKEKIELTEQLWSSVEEELLPVTNNEIDFAEQRLKLHHDNTTEGMSLDTFKKFINDKYSFH